MRHTYCALVHEQEPTDPHPFIVDFPDFDFCKTEGDTIEDVKMMAEDVLALTIQVMQEDKKALPVPTTDYKKLLAKADPDFGPVAFVMPVTVYTAKEPKAAHINITIPEDKLEILSDFINSCGMKRSTFMVAAAMEKMARMKNGE